MFQETLRFSHTSYALCFCKKHKMSPKSDLRNALRQHEPSTQIRQEKDSRTGDEQPRSPYSTTHTTLQCGSIKSLPIRQHRVMHMLKLHSRVEGLFRPRLGTSQMLANGGDTASWASQQPETTWFYLIKTILFRSTVVDVD